MRVMQLVGGARTRAGAPRAGGRADDADRDQPLAFAAADPDGQRRAGPSRLHTHCPRRAPPKPSEGGLVIAVAPCGRSAQPSVGPRGAWAGHSRGGPSPSPRSPRSQRMPPYAAPSARGAFAATLAHILDGGTYAAKPTKQPPPPVSPSVDLWMNTGTSAGASFAPRPPATGGSRPRDAAAAAHTKARGRWAGEAPTSVEPSRRWHPRGVVPIELIY